MFSLSQVFFSPTLAIKLQIEAIIHNLNINEQPHHWGHRAELTLEDMEMRELSMPSVILILFEEDSPQKSLLVRDCLSYEFHFCLKNCNCKKIDYGFVKLYRSWLHTHAQNYIQKIRVHVHHKHRDTQAAVNDFDTLKKCKQCADKKKSNPSNSTTNILEIYFLWVL